MAVVRLRLRCRNRNNERWCRRTRSLPLCGGIRGPGWLANCWYEVLVYVELILADELTQRPCDRTRIQRDYPTIAIARKGCQTDETKINNAVFCKTDDLVIR